MVEAGSWNEKFKSRKHKDLYHEACPQTFELLLSNIAVLDDSYSNIHPGKVQWSSLWRE
jgi:hypothetical protein